MHQWHFYAGLHINYFPVMFIFIIIANIIANVFFFFLPCKQDFAYS